jgi:methylsterol monooxygenase
MSNQTFILLTLALILTSNLIGFLYSYILLYSGWFEKDKIQNKKPKMKIFWERLPLIAINLSLLLSFSSVGLWIAGDWFSREVPFWYVFVGHIFLMFLIDDAYFYFYHRALHENKYLMQYIHRIHHQATAPFPLEYLYGHPLEWLMGAIGPLLAILLLMVFQEVSIYTFWVYSVLRTFHEILIHSGLYTSSFMKFFPFYGTNEHHDRHHEKLKGNYASTFTYLDKLFRTEINR